jgi:hypothetical protein
MKRREFLAVGGVGIAALATANTALALGIEKDFVEVRRYIVKDADKQKQLVEVLDKALIPALNRQGIKPVGVFVPVRSNKNAKYLMNVFVVIPHKDPMKFITLNDTLLADADFRKDAAPIFATTSKDPVYTDCETCLLNTFPTTPVVEVPELGPDRVFEWRHYRSFNIERNAAKIKMFDVGGELPIFREVGLNPIFFGDVLAGTMMPALLYMIGCPSMEKHAEAWRVFGAHPKWREIRGLPEYADTATEIDNVIMTPSPGSQI